MKGDHAKKALLRGAALLLLSVAFGRNYGIGENVFEGLGLKIWSDGTDGYYYPGILALILFIAGSVMFACTTKDRRRTLYYILVGFLLIGFVSWFAKAVM